MGSATTDSKTPYNYAHTTTPKAAWSHRYTAAKKKRPTDRSRTRRTDEVPFIVACSHFTRKNTRFRAPASSPQQSPCNIMQPFQCAPLPFVTTSLRHHFPSSALPFFSTSLRHHSPSSSLPFFTTSLRHHFPSSPLPFIITSLRHHFPSSTSLPHYFPSSPLPIVPTSLLLHFPSSPLPFIITSLLHHFPSSPLPFVTTSLRHHFPSSPPVINCFLFFCYVLLCDLPPCIISSRRILFVRNTEVLLPNFLW